jgi:serine/threonine protein kinase
MGLWSDHFYYFEVLLVQDFLKSIRTHCSSSGTTPFHADNNAELFEQIMSGDYSFHPSTWEGVSEEAKDLVRQLLTVDPKKRISARDALKHKWFSEDLRGRMARLDTKDRLTQWNLKRKVRRNHSNAIRFSSPFFLFVTPFLQEENEKEREMNREISEQLTIN